MSSNNVNTARSLLDVQKAESSFEKGSFRLTLSRFVIYFIVALSNSILAILKLSLFKRSKFDKKHISNITAYSTGTLGDNVVILSALAALKRRFPRATLTSVVNCDKYSTLFASEILGGVGFIDKVITLPDHPVQRQGLTFKINAPGIERGKCDLFVNLSPFGNRGWLGAVVREMIFARWLGAKRAVGFRVSSFGRTKGMFNAVQHYFMQNEPRRSTAVLDEIGIIPVSGEDLLPKSDEARNSVLIKLSDSREKGKPLFLLNPGAKFIMKRWPPDRFAKTASILSKEYGATIVIAGMQSERQLAEQVERTSGIEVINLAGKTTIKELVELLRIADACVTNDTGTMHLAAMTSTPTVALFSTRMSPSHWLPAGGNVVSVFSFASSTYSYSDEGGTSECLLNISVGDVLDAFSMVYEK